tara:strand:- start:1018 stop:1956 length:939 start_codon:yes stop_codon:yes gene_type:complete
MLEKNLKSFQHMFEYAVFKFLVAVAAPLSYKTVYNLGKKLGEILYRFGGKRKRIIFTNLEIAFENTLSYKEKKNVARNSFIHLVVSILQCLWLKIDPENRSNELFTEEPEGLDVIRQCLERKKGVFILTAHYGNWEAMGIRHGYLDVPPLHSIARKLDNPYLEKEIFLFRSASGNKVFYKDISPLKLVRVLKNNGCVAILLDQNTAKGGVFVDFLGKKAATARSIALLSLASDAAIVPMFCVATGEGRYKIRYGPEIIFKPSGNKEKDILDLTQICADFIGDQIRQNPAPWMWLHRRWKTRPAEEIGLKVYP